MTNSSDGPRPIGVEEAPAKFDDERAEPTNAEVRRAKITEAADDFMDRHEAAFRELAK
jgi:hypothetical protein